MLKEKFEQIKAHLKEHQDVYIPIGTALVSAGITCLVMRGVASRSVSDGIVADATQGGIVAVLGDRNVLNNVSFISSNRQGPPAWVIRCIETDEVFTSQKRAALSMGIPQNELSQHLNGQRDSVHGRTFERICMAV